MRKARIEKGHPLFADLDSLGALALTQIDDHPLGDAGGAAVVREWTHVEHLDLTDRSARGAQ